MQVTWVKKLSEEDAIGQFLTRRGWISHGSIGASYLREGVPRQIVALRYSPKQRRVAGALFEQHKQARRDTYRRRIWPNYSTALKLASQTPRLRNSTTWDSPATS